MRLFSVPAVALFALILSTTASAQTYPLNELPMFGGQERTPAMIEADEQMFKNAEKMGYNRVQSSDKSVQLGWQYFQKKDIATAMKRFNQAWLFDAENGDAFHGFAVLTMARDNDTTKAGEYFATGVAKPRQSPGIYLDYGRFLLATKKFAEAVVQLNKALSSPDMGPDAQALLTQALYFSGDIKGACAATLKVSDRAQKPLVEAARAIGKLQACAAP